MNATKELQKHDEKLAKAEREAREAEQAQRDAQAGLQAVKEQWTAHFEQEDADPLPRDLHNAQNEVEREAPKPWPEIIAGRRRRAMKVRTERDQFVVDRVGELAASREHDAHAAREAVIEALERIEVAERAWASVEQFYTELLRAVPGIDGRDVPSLNLSAVKGEAQRVLTRHSGAAAAQPLRGR
jgi:hypothetical protein